MFPVVTVFAGVVVGDGLLVVDELPPPPPPHADRSAASVMADDARNRFRAMLLFFILIPVFRAVTEVATVLRRPMQLDSYEHSIKLHISCTMVKSPTRNSGGFSS